MRQRRTAVLIRVVLAVLVCVLAVPGLLQAQARGGNIQGTVVDSQKVPLPGVTVNATNKETGLRRATTTGIDGGFLIRELPVGSYAVAVELSGFATVTVDEVKVQVATARTLEVTMSLAKVQETITVVDTPPLIESEAATGTVVSQDQIENLPLNGRQFANLAVLAPGTTLGYNTDPTKPGQLVVALNGGSGRNVNYIMDGGDNTDDTIGGALQNFNLEAVQEFKIQTSQYKAEYGRSSGGVLSVVTKSGTNEFRGSAYEFFRDKSLNGSTEAENRGGSGKGPYRRNQYGGSVGGPIQKDKAHFFATFEKTGRDQGYFVETNGIYPAIDGTFQPLVPFNDTLVTAKVTVEPTPAQLLQVRYGYQKNQDTYGQADNFLPSALGVSKNKYSSVLVGHTWQLGGTALNEATFQYTKFNNAIVPTSDEPSIYFASGVTQGQNFNTPQDTNQTKYHYKDDLSWSSTIGSHRHDFKAGLSYVNEPTLGGDFTTGVLGTFALLGDTIDSPVASISYYGGFFGDSTPVKQYSAYFQDDWYPSPRVTVNVGLRYDLNTGFNLDQRTSPLWQALHTQRTYTEKYLKDFWDDDGVLDEDRNNFAPRVGFSWDTSGDGKAILRGGFGRFYDFPYTNATILFPAAAVQSTYGLTYFNSDESGIRNSDGSFFQIGQTLPLSQLPPGVSANAPNEVASPTLKTPYSDQVSLGYSWQANAWLGLTVDALGARYRDIPFRFRGNPTSDANGNSQIDPRFPDFGRFRIWYGNGFADYKGLSLAFHVRQAKFEVQGFYTLSKSDGNILAGADEFRITSGFGGELQSDTGGSSRRRDQSVNPLDPLCDACTGPLYTDARHRITIGGTYKAPWDVALSGFVRYHSGFPYTRFGNCDLNGDGSTMDLGDGVTKCPGTDFAPPAVSHVNDARMPSFSQFDIRISKDFIFAEDLGVEALVEMFNVFNSKNPTRPDRFGTAHAFAGDIGQGEQRLVQLGLRFHF